MRSLAFFMFISMMGGVSEVLFMAAKDFINGRFSQTAERLHDPAVPIHARVFFAGDAAAIELNDAGIESKQVEPGERFRGAQA